MPYSLLKLKQHRTIRRAYCHYIVNAFIADYIGDIGILSVKVLVYLPASFEFSNVHFQRIIALFYLVDEGPVGSMLVCECTLSFSKNPPKSAHYHSDEGTSSPIIAK